LNVKNEDQSDTNRIFEEEACLYTLNTDKSFCGMKVLGVRKGGQACANVFHCVEKIRAAVTEENCKQYY